MRPCGWAATTQSHISIELEGDVKMLMTHYRIHLVNGEVIHMAECTEDDTQPFLKRFQEAKPDAILKCGMTDGPQAHIPVQKILYISTFRE